jgi:hypothetical protein
MNCQTQFHRNTSQATLNRRWFLQQCGIGLGGMALSGLLSAEQASASAIDPLAIKMPHYAPKAKRVI